MILSFFRVMSPSAVLLSPTVLRALPNPRFVFFPFALSSNVIFSGPHGGSFTRFHHGVVIDRSYPLSFLDEVYIVS